MLNPKHKKKKSRKEITVSNGIKLSSDIQFYTEKNHNKINSFLFPFMMAFFCAYSTVILTISFVPLEINFKPVRERSAGEIQGIPFSHQYSGTVVEGVAPLTISPKSATVPILHPCGKLLGSMLSMKVWR